MYSLSVISCNGGYEQVRPVISIIIRGVRVHHERRPRSNALASILSSPRTVAEHVEVMLLGCRSCLHCCCSCCCWLVWVLAKETVTRRRLTEERPDRGGQRAAGRSTFNRHHIYAHIAPCVASRKRSEDSYMHTLTSLQQFCHPPRELSDHALTVCTVPEPQPSATAAAHDSTGEGITPWMPSMITG